MELLMNTAEKKIHHAIADWVGDIVALETHVEEAMDRQLKLDFPTSDTAAAIRRFHDAVRSSKQRAEAYQEQYGSEPGNPIIKAGSNLLGKAAGMIDLMREDGVAKALRDDYTAYNLLAISYGMLHTTAAALEDPATQAFAEQGLRTYACLVQDINHLMPEAIVEELKDNDDHPLQNTSVVDESRRLIQHVWQSTASD
jgi:ferritin-like metal-binding protein YciE